MSRIRRRGGWMLYGGDLGMIAAEVLSADISTRISSLDVTSIMGPVRQVNGPPDITFTAQLSEKIHWDKTAQPGEPPDLGALLMLARRHPEEYEYLRQGEAVLKVLGG